MEVMEMEIGQRRAVCLLDKICKVPSNIKYEVVREKIQLRASWVCANNPCLDVVRS